MKKLLLSLSLFLCLGNYAQPIAQVLRITPDPVCADDTIKIDFKIHGSGGAYITLLTQHIGTLGGATHVAWSVTCADTIHFRKEYCPGLPVGDSAYYFKCRVPYNYVNQTSIFICSLSYSLGFTSNDCYTGIKENNFELNEIPIYFDLQGNRIIKKTNELIIEQVGFRRKKVFITP